MPGFKNRTRHTATTLLLASFIIPSIGSAAAQQTDSTTHQQHDQAQADQDAHDKAHHNTAKTVGGTAAGGAVIGAVAGGGKGALIGGAAGAGAGVVADKVRKHKGVKKRERREAAEQPQ